MMVLDFLTVFCFFAGIGVFLYRFYNLLKLGGVYDYISMIILFITQVMLFGFHFFTFLSNNLEAIYIVLFKFHVAVFGLAVMVLLGELIVLFRAKAAGRTIKPYYSNGGV